jgi:hypothetical protein
MICTKLLPSSHSYTQKASFPDICRIPLQANESIQNTGVSFDFDHASVKTNRALNLRENMRFMGCGDKIKQNNGVGLTSPPTRI